MCVGKQNIGGGGGGGDGTQFSGRTYFQSTKKMEMHDLYMGDGKVHSSAGEHMLRMHEVNRCNPQPHQLKVLEWKKL